MSRLLAKLRCNSWRQLARSGSSKGAGGLVLLIVLVAFGLRLYRVGYQSIWYDEAVSVHLASKDLHALTLHTAGDIHPPLYYYLLHFWILVAGRGEFSLAFLSLVFGMLLVGGCYRLGSDLCDGRVGVVAAFLVAISPFNVWYSQEIRMYTLGALLGLVSLYCLTRLAGMARRDVRGDGPSNEDLSARDSRPWLFWSGYVLSAAAGLYTLYYFVFLLLFENLFVVGWWLVGRLRGREHPLSLGRWLLAQCLVLILFAPWMPIAARQALYPPVPAWRGFTGLASMLAESWAALSLGQSVDPESLLVWPLLSFIFAVYLVGMFGRADSSRRWPTEALLCGYTFAPLVAIYLLSIRAPLFHVRYMFTYSPPFYVLLGLGLVRLGRSARMALPVSLAVIGLASGYSMHRLHFVPQYQADDHRSAVRYIEERMAPGDAVLINAGYAYPAFLYYYDGELSWRGRLVEYQPGGESQPGIVVLQTGSIGDDEGLGWGDPDSDFYATSEGETADALERVFGHHERVWTYRIYDTVTDPEGFIRGWLDEHGRRIGDQEFAGESYMRVQCYVTDVEPAHDPTPVRHPLDHELVAGFQLVGYEAPDAVRSGEHVQLALHWQVSSEATRDSDLYVGLAVEESALGAEWVATEPLPLPRYGGGPGSWQKVDLQIPPGTPPVKYHLIVELRQASSGGAAAPGVGRAVIGQIQVLRPLVPPPTPPMTHESWANFGNALQLTGYDLELRQVEPGGELCAEFFWRAWDVPLPLVEVSLELRDSGVQAGRTSGFLRGVYPSTLWGREELVRDVICLHIPERVPARSYQLTVALEAIQVSGQREVMPVWSPAGRWEESLILGDVEVDGP